MSCICTCHTDESAYLCEQCCEEIQTDAGKATLPWRECTGAEMQDHVIQLAALGMCCINRPLWEGRAAIEEYLRRHFIPRRQNIDRECI